VYVQNSIWVDFTVGSQAGDLRLKGETDPVFVDAEGVPILLTEIKTKDSIEHLDSPNDHHLAQAHAYMFGLNQKFDRRITDALLVYVDRSTLDLKAFHTKFDDEFWNDTVLHWAATHTEYQIDDELPPLTPSTGGNVGSARIEFDVARRTRHIGTTDQMGCSLDMTSIHERT